jgi:hypothetical protein
MNQKQARKKRKLKEKEKEHMKQVAISTVEKINQDIEFAEMIIDELLYGKNYIKNPIHHAALKKVIEHYRSIVYKGDE